MENLEIPKEVVVKYLGKYIKQYDIYYFVKQVQLVSNYTYLLCRKIDDPSDIIIKTDGKDKVLTKTKLSKLITNNKI
jgi:hypothetical protein